MRSRPSARRSRGLPQEGFPAERVALIGFSQGGCLALEYAARNAKRYGAVAGLSAGLIGPPGTPRDYAGSLAGTPVFLGCSDIDSHVPLARVHEIARRARDAWAASVTERIYPGMGHTVNADEIAHVSKLLAGIGRHRVKIPPAQKRENALLQKPNVPVIAIEEHYADPELYALFTGLDAATPPHVVEKLEGHRRGAPEGHGCGRHRRAGALALGAVAAEDLLRRGRACAPRQRPARADRRDRSRRAMRASRRCRPPIRRRRPTSSRAASRRSASRAR